MHKRDQHALRQQNFSNRPGRASIGLEVPFGGKSVFHSDNSYGPKDESIGSLEKSSGLDIDVLEQQDFCRRLVSEMVALSLLHSDAKLQTWLEASFPMLLPYGILCIDGKITGDLLQIKKMMRHRYSEQAFEAHIKPCTLQVTQEMHRCLASQEPVFLRAGPSEGDSRFGADTGTNHADAHIIMSEFNKKTGSVAIVSFSSLPPAVPPGILTTLRLLSTHLQAALTRSANSGVSMDTTATGLISAHVQLTPRESEVMHWMILGKSNWSISIIIDCCESTVKSHLKSVFFKLGVNSRVQAAQKWTALQQQK